MKKLGTNVPNQPTVPPMPYLNKSESFSIEADFAPESKEALNQIIGEVSVFTADCIGFINKETGEEKKFVCEEKVKKVISKIEELKKHYPCFAECANACVEIIEEGLSIDE